MCVIASVGFCGYVSMSDRPATTTHRKFFHLTVTLIAVTGLDYDPRFLLLSAHLMLIVFILIELLRALDVPPWSTHLNQWLLVFLDEQDSLELVLTPILLLLGVFMPVYVFPVDRQTMAAQAWHFAGVLSVGIGDAFAALIGSRYGRTRWPWAAKRKSVEGSLAMFAAQALAVPLLGLPASFGTLCAVLGSTLAEAHLTWADNVVPPAIAMLCLRYLP
ncbi:Protein Y56A3A.36 [Aphelenchoides avenae]|nr:Protein Y56A3A.36 [Aphelenchus avenae]